MASYPYNPNYKPERGAKDPPEQAPPSIRSETPVVECDIPLATEVIVIPNEPTREDTDRFWNYDEEAQAAPKSGVGCIQGWITEISPLYTTFYAVTVTFVSIALLSLTGAFGPSCDGYFLTVLTTDRGYGRCSVSQFYSTYCLSLLA